MYYAEILYARRRLLIFAAVAVLVAAVFTYFVTFPPPNAHVVNNGQDVPFDAVLGFGGFFATIMASMVAASMNRSSLHLPYVWTKPASRERTALSYMLVDILTILAAFAVVVAICSIVLALPPRNRMTFDHQTLLMLSRSLAVPLMLYAVVEAATSWTPRRLAAAGGLIWPIGFALDFLTEINLPFPLAQVFFVLNIFNPIAYIPTIRFHSHLEISASSPLPLDFNGQTIVALCIFVLACCIATYNWRRMQA